MSGPKATLVLLIAVRRQLKLLQESMICRGGSVQPISLFQQQQFATEINEESQTPAGPESQPNEQDCYLPCTWISKGRRVERRQLYLDRDETKPTGRKNARDAETLRKPGSLVRQGRSSAAHLSPISHSHQQSHGTQKPESQLPTSCHLTNQRLVAIHSSRLTGKGANHGNATVVQPWPAGRTGGV
jgi:hypothetical protein